MPSGLISTSSVFSGAIRMAATCGSKAVVESPWKEDDQSIELSPPLPLLLPVPPNNEGDVVWTACTKSLPPSVGAVGEEEEEDEEGWGVAMVGRGSSDVSTSSTLMALNVVLGWPLRLL